VAKTITFILNKRHFRVFSYPTRNFGLRI